MIGAIIGDIVGSIYEFNNIKTKKFKLFTENNYFTDDSVLTIAIGKSLIDCNLDYSLLHDIVIKNIQEIGRLYPYSDYGGMFSYWLYDENPKPYNSYGNGAPMRVSACGIVGKSLEEVKYLAKTVTEITHNHPYALLAAEAVATCIYYARQNKSKEFLFKYINDNYYKLDFTLDEIRYTYEFNETSQNTTPQALVAFFESTDFEDAIRNAISIGGDSDTLAAITGSIAASYYKVDKEMVNKAYSYLDKGLKKIVNNFSGIFGLY